MPKEMWDTGAKSSGKNPLRRPIGGPAGPSTPMPDTRHPLRLANPSDLREHGITLRGSPQEAFVLIGNICEAELRPQLNQREREAQPGLATVFS